MASKKDLDGSVELIDILKRLCILQGTFAERARELAGKRELSNAAWAGGAGVAVGLLFALTMEVQHRGDEEGLIWCAKAAEHYGVWPQLQATTKAICDIRAKINELGDKKYSAMFYANELSAINAVHIQDDDSNDAEKPAHKGFEV